MVATEKESLRSEAAPIVEALNTEAAKPSTYPEGRSFAVDSRKYNGEANLRQGTDTEENIIDGASKLKKLTAQLRAKKGELSKVTLRHKSLWEFIQAMFKWLRCGSVLDGNGGELHKLHEAVLPTTYLGALFDVLVERAMTGNQRTVLPTFLINFAISLATVSPKAYRELRAVFPDMPAEDTINRHKLSQARSSLGCSDKSLLRFKQFCIENGITDKVYGVLLNDDMNIQSVSCCLC